MRSNSCIYSGQHWTSPTDNESILDIHYHTEHHDVVGLVHCYVSVVGFLYYKIISLYVQYIDESE